MTQQTKGLNHIHVIYILLKKKLKILVMQEFWICISSYEIKTLKKENFPSKS